MASRSPLKVAILGAGAFVTDAYLEPLAANSGQLLVTAAWSRSERSVEELVIAVHRFSPSCKAFNGDEGLQELLRSGDVEACLVVLPPQVQGAVVQAALRAGKHVLSEKPVAPTLAQAEQLLAFHKSLPQPAPVWAVAENYRCMEGLLRLRDTIAAGTLGTIARLDMATDLALHPGAKYFSSQWRRDSETMPGAYLTEGGVHFVAALRMMAGAAGWGQATEVAACARGISDNLPHPDTLQGLVWFEGGAAASYSMTTAAGSMHVALRAVGTRGEASAERGGGAAKGHAFRLVQLLGGQATPTQMESSSTGVEEELLCFARLARAARAGPGGVSLTLTAREAGAAAATDGSDPEPDATGAGAAGRDGRGGGGVGAAEVAAEPAEAQPAGERGERVEAGSTAWEAEAGGGGSGEAEAEGVRGRRSGSPSVTERAGKARLQEMPSQEDAWRISSLEAARDLALVVALLESAAKGGEKMAVAQL